MTLDTQASLFGEGGMTPPRRSTDPDLSAIRRRLTDVLETLRAAEEVMPLSERDLKMWKTVWPNMTKWLPEDEALDMRSRFTIELERLAAPVRAATGPD